MNHTLDSGRGSRPMDVQTFAIGILSVTACILLVAFLLVGEGRPAWASGQGDRGGDYLMSTVQLSESVEGVAVIDAASKLMNVYSYDYNRKSIELVSPRIRLDKLPNGGERKKGG